MTITLLIEEEWRPVVGYEGLYSVSNAGRVYSHINEMLLRPGRASNGYYTVALCQTSHTIHSLVLNAFVGPCPPGYVCRHLNGVRANSALWNVCWGTPTQNNLDKKYHMTRRSSSQKLTPSDVKAIDKLLENGWSQLQVAKHFNVTRRQINNVARRQHHADVI